MAVGGQYQATDRLTLRSGYLYNTNPIKGTDTLFNIQAPGFMTQMLALGASYKLTDDIVLSLAWTHQFRNSISGPVLQIPGERIKLDAQMDSIVVGLNVQFGGPRKHADNSISGDEVSPPAVPAGITATPPPVGFTATPPLAVDGPAAPATLPSATNVVSEGRKTSAVAKLSAGQDDGP